MDIQEIIKNRYRELPEDMQQAIKSTDLAEKFETIANKHNLHIDQNGALQTETILVMLGLEPTENYVDNLQKNLEISRDEASLIAEDVNNDILNSIKDSLMTIQQQSSTDEDLETPSVTPQIALAPENLPTSSDLSAIEKAGGFTIEKSIPENTSSLYDDKNINKEAVLKGIENPEPSMPASMIDHLLTTPIHNPEKIEVKNQEKKAYDADPYREQV